MAGGDPQILRTPYPKGDDGYVMLRTKTFSTIASQTGLVFDTITVPFAFQAVYAEIAGVVTTAVGTTFTFQDDTGTPKVIINAAPVATQAVGAVTALPVVRTVTINAGALLNCKYTTGAGDTSVATVITLWVKPVF